MKRISLLYIMLIFVVPFFFSCSDDDEDVNLDNVSIVVTPKVSDLELGSSLQLRAITKPENLEVIWLTSDESIATVSENGTVESKSVGSVQITAKYKSVKSYSQVKVTSDVFMMPQEMVGTWKCEKIELRSEGVVYDEEEIKEKWYATDNSGRVLTEEERQNRIVTVRNSYYYEAYEGDKLDMNMALDYGYRAFPGTLDYKDGQEYSFITEFDMTEWYILTIDPEIYVHQPVKYNGTYVVVETPVGYNTLISYYRVEKRNKLEKNRVSGFDSSAIEQLKGQL